MSLELVVSGAVGAGVLYYWGLRRIGRMRSYSDRQRSVDAFRAARAMLAVDEPYRAVTDPAVLANLAAATGQQAALVAVGFAPLGDYVVVGPEGSSVAVVRALVNADRTVCGVIMVTLPNQLVFVQLTSFSAELMFTTRRGKSAGLATAPSIQSQTLAIVPIAELLAKHIAFARAPVSIASFEELLARANAARAASNRWRDAQPPDELLDADLRGAMGPQYDRWGNVWAARIREEIPQARLR